MPLDGESYYADAATLGSLETITAAMAAAEADQFEVVNETLPIAASDHTAVTHEVGLIVLNTTTGVLYVSTGSAWQAIGPASSLKRTPTSIAGTGATLSGARIALSSATGNINVNGVFMSAFKHYRMRARLTIASSGGGIGMTLRASGTDSSTGYDRQRLSGVSTTASAAQSLNQSSWETVASVLTAGTHLLTCELSNPADALFTVGQLITSSTDHSMTTAAGINSATLNHRTASAYDGFSLALGSAVVTGYIMVEGYVD